MEEIVVGLLRQWLETRESLGADAGPVILEWAEGKDTRPEDANYYLSIAPTWTSLAERDSIDLSLILRHLVESNKVSLAFVKGHLKNVDFARSAMRKAVRDECETKRRKQ